VIARIAATISRCCALANLPACGRRRACFDGARLQLADEIRADGANTNWHFVNIEIGSKSYDPRRDCARDDCVVAQINRDIAVLRDPKAPHAAKIEALRFLIHFVGDLHQPLHAADRRDKGGNGLIVFMKNRRTNLHRVWDEDLVEALGPMPARSPAASSRLSPEGKAKLAAGTPANWANESFSVAAKEIYARIPSRGPVRLPRDYAGREKNSGAGCSWRAPELGSRCCSTRFIADQCTLLTQADVNGAQDSGAFWYAKILIARQLAQRTQHALRKIYLSFRLPGGLGLRIPAVGGSG